MAETNENNALEKNENEKGYEVKLPTFQGPLELLLFLIKNKELEIEEISISLITQDYLEYVKHYHETGHSSIAEFLAMAATLLYIKSLTVLPVHQEAELDEELEDPRKALVYQLVEYQKVKRMVQFLEYKEGGSIFSRKENPFLSSLKERVVFKEAGFKELLDLYIKFFKPIKGNSIIQGKIKDEISTVDDKVHWISNLLNEKARVSFFNIINNLKRSDKIVSFIAGLEMGKQREAYLTQEDLFKDIFIEKGKNHGK